jgi:hypothetical protein
MVFPIYYKMYHGRSEDACGSRMMLLQIISAVLCVMSSTTIPTTDGQAEENPLRGPRAHLIWIIRISSCGGHLKALVYPAPFHNIETLHQRTVLNSPRIFERVRRSIVRHGQACIKSHGERFEHLCKRTNSVL